MFLATTALTDYWDKSQKILFLGEWCKIYTKRHIWNNLNFETLEYHWDDRVKLYNDYLYINTIYEKYLIQLSNKLNIIHNTNYPIRYWRIIIGPWLRYFCEILYDRYLSIKCAIESGKVTNTFIVKYPDNKWLPLDFTTFLTLMTSDDYNFFLYGKIIELLNGFNFTYVEKPIEKGQAELDFHKFNFKKLVKYFLKSIGKIIPYKFNKIVIESSYFKVINLLKLQISLGQFPYLVSPKLSTYRHKIDTNLREIISFNKSNDNFINILNELLKYSIPQTYIEDYHSFSKKAQKAFPQKPKIIMTLNAYSSNEGFKFWTALNIINSTKLIIGQHGGHYGTGLFSSTQEHEISIADKYISLGWNKNKSNNVIPLVFNKYIKPMKFEKLVKNANIYLNLNLGPRYSYRLYSIPIGPQWLNYTEQIILLIKRLNIEVSQKLFCRSYPLDYGWDFNERILSECQIYFVKTNLNWDKELRKAKLVIETCNLTTVLVSMMYNIPTIIFFQPKYWELSEEAESIFKELKRVGIYHTDLESTAKQVNSVSNNILEWWYSKELQKVRREFCQKFSKQSPNWVLKWKNFIKNELNSSTIKK